MFTKKRKKQAKKYITFESKGCTLNVHFRKTMYLDSYFKLLRKCSFKAVLLFDNDQPRMNE